MRVYNRVWKGHDKSRPLVSGPRGTWPSLLGPCVAVVTLETGATCLGW